MSPQGPHWESPILQSVLPVVAAAGHVTTNPDAIDRVADWMAYEEFPPATGATLFGLGDDPDLIMDHTMVINIINFAFTDFTTGVKFQTDYQGRTWYDSEAMVACVHRELTNGTPMLSGSYLSQVDEAELRRVFSGNIEMPMAAERAAAMRNVGQILVDHYDGAFHNFIRSCTPSLFDNGDGILERLVREFPRFNDVSQYGGHSVQIQKLAQLALWSLHLTLSPRGHWSLTDVGKFTAFADYIVPVALRVMDVFSYSESLEQRINSGVLIARDSEEEVELRAHSVYAAALLTDAINARRVGLPPLVVPQVDYRLWSHYHATHWPHHLTVTTMY